MKTKPNIALLGSLIGDAARASMLTALQGGRALTATELATEAGVTVQTASSHLGKMEAALLIRRQKQGRHHYFSLADDDVGSVLAALQGLAAKQGHMRVQTGPKDPALRKARVCYRHLAGEMGVHLYDSLRAQGFVSDADEEIQLTDGGYLFATYFGIDIEKLNLPRRPLCKSCLDWSVRRTHLAGSLGRALLDNFYARGWASRQEGTRVVAFSASGEKEFLSRFPV